MTPERLHRILWHLQQLLRIHVAATPDTCGLFTILNTSPGKPVEQKSIAAHVGMSVHVLLTPTARSRDTKVLDEFFAVFDECKPVSELAHHPNTPGARTSA